MATHRDKRGDSQMLPVMVLLRAAQRGGQPTVVSFMGPSLGPMILFFHLGGPSLPLEYRSGHFTVCIQT
ncbi:hypothetical protein Peur_005026 [Populus x canadensis]